MYECINLTKKNFVQFKALNNLRYTFNTLNENFIEVYDRANFTKQIFLRRKVKLLQKDSKIVGYIWFTTKDKNSIKINSMNVMKNEDLLLCYNNLINCIDKKKNLIYTCEKNDYNFEILNSLNFKKNNGIVQLSLNLDDISNSIIMNKIEEEQGLEMEKVVKGKKEEIRCRMQNEIFNSANRVPLSVEDIYFDELQEYYYDKGAILLKKDNKYIGYGQIIFDNKKPFIVNFGIIKECRNKGYGKKLLKYLICILVQNKFKEVKIRVYSENIPALSLYKSLGFTIENESCDWEIKR